MGSPDCPFNLRVSLTVIDHAFHNSVGDGFRAIGEEINNVFSRGREVLVPDKPFPDLEYEIVNNRLHWSGDRMSVEHHLRRYIVWLKANGGTETQLDQARLDVKVFREVQRRALGLSDNNAIMWLAQKTTEPSDGVALQQIRKQDGKLIQSSQLLPFDQQNQIDNFRDQLSQHRDDISIDDSVGGWIIQGLALDFEQDLPEMIEQAMQPVVLAEAMSVMMPLPEITNTGLFEPLVASVWTESLTETPRPVSETSGFWFEVMAAAAATRGVVETPAPLFEVPTRTDLEGAVTVFEAPIVKQEVINLEPKQQLNVTVVKPRRCFPEVSSRTDLEGATKATTETQIVVKPTVINLEPKQQLNVTVVKPRRCFPDEKRILEKPEITALVIKNRITPTIVFESAVAAAVVAPTKLDLEDTKQQLDVTVVNDRRCLAETVSEGIPTRLDLEGLEGANQIQQVVFSVDNRHATASKISTDPKQRTKARTIPIYQHNWQPVAIKEIPEWGWQGTAAGPDEIVDWPWFLVTMFYALLNTKVLLNEKIS